MAGGGGKTLEPIDKVIERCRHRIDHSLDVNVGDIIRLIEEIERHAHEHKKMTLAVPLWSGLGNGD